MSFIKLFPVYHEDGTVTIEQKVMTDEEQKDTLFSKIVEQLKAEESGGEQGTSSESAIPDPLRSFFESVLTPAAPKIPKAKRTALPRIELARAVRDHLMPIIIAEGVLERVGKSRCVRWKTGDWQAIYITPFSNFHDWPSDHKTYTEAVLCREKRAKTLPYQLDVWRGKKVCSIEWNDDEIKIISFQSGDWYEDAMLIQPTP